MGRCRSRSSVQERSTAGAHGNSCGACGTSRAARTGALDLGAKRFIRSAPSPVIREARDRDLGRRSLDHRRRRRDLEPRRTRDRSRVPTGRHAREDALVLCVHNMHRAPLQPETLYMQFHGGVYRSDDAGVNWTDIGLPGGLPTDFGFPLVIDPADPDCGLRDPARLGRGHGLRRAARSSSGRRGTGALVGTAAPRVSPRRTPTSRSSGRRSATTEGARSASTSGPRPVRSSARVMVVRRGLGWPRTFRRCARFAARHSPRRFLSCARCPTVLRAILDAVDEAQARPGLVDRCDLVVDEPDGEPGFLNDLEGHVGRDPGGLLGPRDPKAPARGKSRLQLGESLLVTTRRVREEDDHVQGAGKTRLDPDPVGKRAEGGGEVTRERRRSRRRSPP